MEFPGTLPPKLDLNVGPTSHFYQPPGPSATSSLCSTQASKIGHSQKPLSKRKRSCHRTPSSATLHLVYGDLLSEVPGPQPLRDEADVVHSSQQTILKQTESPVPFADETHIIKDGLATPTAVLAHAFETHCLSPDASVHRGSNTNMTDGSCEGSYFPQAIDGSALAEERNGHSKNVTSPGLRDGLARAVYTVPFLAGKVWEFCRSSAFKGFFAGEGQGYELGACRITDNQAHISWHDLEEKDLRGPWRDESMLTPVPGGFPLEDYIPDYMSYDHTQSSPPRAAKRQQMGQASGQLSDSWIMTDTHRPMPREISPSRLVTRKVPPASPTRRPTSRLGKRPKLPMSRPSLISRSYAGSPGVRSDQLASFPSPRSPGPRSPPKYNSPVSEEVQRHATRLRRRALEEDANLKRMNEQMKALIKEGKEALGTKFEVDEENDATMGEGYG